MSNGIQCCALDLPCCKPPGSQVKAVAKVVRMAIDLPPEQVTCVAECLLEQFDLVPKGVGKAIVEGYRHWLVTETPGHEDAGKVIASTDGPFVLGDEPLEVDLNLKPEEAGE